MREIAESFVFVLSHNPRPNLSVISSKQGSLILSVKLSIFMATLSYNRTFEQGYSTSISNLVIWP